MSRTYFILTFGCQMNQSDSERMSTVLEGLKFKSVDKLEDADLIILNTCSVKQKAEDRVNGFIKNIKEKNSKAIVVISGCIARRIWDDTQNVKNSSQKNYVERVEELKKSFPLADILIETKNFYQIKKHLSILFNDPTINLESKEKPEHYLSFKPKYKSTFQAYVPISTGCNHFCTFCIVPFARGKEVCRPAQEIIREVFELVQRGYKDITLLGQTVNRWINPDFINEFEYNEAMTRIKGLNENPMDNKELIKWGEFFKEKFSPADTTDDEEINPKKLINQNLSMPKDFLQLLQVLDQIPGQWWTTWYSSHPNYMTKELISFVGESSSNLQKNLKENFTAELVGHQRPFLHFALQSGSDLMLKRMNRRHEFKEFLKRIKLIRKVVKNISLSTDIIVGFINETEDDFLKTIEAENLCRFDMIYISEFSPRPGTAAARLVDNISNKEKANRKERLNNVLREVARENNSKLLDTKQTVLVDSIDKKKNMLTTRTMHNKELRISNSSDQNLIGKFVDVKVTKTGPWSLEGTCDKLL